MIGSFAKERVTNGIKNGLRDLGVQISAKENKNRPFSSIFPPLGAEFRLLGAQSVILAPKDKLEKL